MAIVEDSYTERKEVRQTKGKPKFLFVTDLLNEIKRSWDEKENMRGQNEQDIVNHYYKIPFLVLDDLGSEKLSEWSRSVLSALINKRHIECMQTIVTTNLSHEELAKYDDRIASRLCEMGEVYDLGEKDWRLG
jgi:DNA replication protein DnaC